MIEIIDGDYPIQNTDTFWGKLHLIKHEGGRRDYLLRASISEISMIEKSKEDITYKVSFSDGNHVVCRSSLKKFNYLCKVKQKKTKKNDKPFEEISKFRNKLESKAGWFLFLLIIIIAASNDKSPSAQEDRAITDQYYALVSQPHLTRKEKQRLRCSGAKNVEVQYRSKGDVENADYWKQKGIGDCRKYREMIGY